LSSSESSPESCTFSEELHPALPLLSIPSIRVFASGPSLVIDLEIVLPQKMSLEEVGRVESVIKKAIGEEMGVGRVREVRIVFKGQ
jgi:divalent metal cation (Fe/Co/Zn/Cd) transporter